MRRPGVRIPSRPPSFKTTSSVPNSSYRGTLGLSSLPDSFRYLVIHQERHCLSAASSVKTSRLGLVGTDPHVAIWTSGYPIQPELMDACLDWMACISIDAPWLLS